ncbi:hypothetical protein [uncultured Sphingomonas sp.]|uniref:hypothetical protein n=1 Tax=uncultured Sphingomonas sp. TaxID=158754 RepID=UPI0035CB9D52
MTAPRILVDADACPVKDEIYKVAWRYAVPVAIVANQRIRIPDHPPLACPPTPAKAGAELQCSW